MQHDVQKRASHFVGEPRPRQPPATPEEPPVDLSKLDYTLIAWLALFVLGGGFLALYYADIGYFPEFTWQDSLTYLALMTIVGGGLVLAYGLLLLAPGAIWSEFLIFDGRIRGAFRLTDGSDLCVLHIARRLLLPFGLFMVACHALAAFSKDMTDFLLGIVLSLAAASFLFGMGLKDEICRTQPDRPSLLCRYILAFDIAASLSAAAVGFFYRLYQTKASPSLLNLCTFMVIVTSLVVSMLFHQHRNLAIMASLVAAVILFVGGQVLERPPGVTGLPAKIMTKFGFGNQGVTLVLTEGGGRLLCQYGLEVKFTDPPRATKDGLARVADVRILSRLGSNFVFIQDRPKHSPVISVRKSEVLSWSTPQVGSEEKVPALTTKCKE